MLNIKELLPLILLEAIPLKMCKKWENKNNASRRWPKKDGAKLIVNKSCCELSPLDICNIILSLLIT
jgi:hypothetical protein